MKIESELYSFHKKLYLALESLDNALKTCDLEGLDIRKISLLKTKLDLLKSNKLERSALDVAEEINIFNARIQKERMSSLFDGLEHKSDLMFRKEQLSEARQKQVLISSLFWCLSYSNGNYNAKFEK